MLNAFAIKTADEKGEFYTPENIVDIITTLIEPYEGKVYDIKTTRLIQYGNRDCLKSWYK